MTKTLTEQWREGKLPENTYYVQFICGRYGIYEFEQFRGFGFDNDLAYIKEVLAPVPSYDIWTKHRKVLTKVQIENCDLKIINEKLKGQLEIATKALKEIEEHTKELSLPSYTGMLCHKALKEMEGVK